MLGSMNYWNGGLFDEFRRLEREIAGVFNVTELDESWRERA